ncbi:hypothetical protein Pyn_09633 [Prunus yedoensis var. nudiflora]|uniref:Uncharacterized protein n=1 Tax=Prunus yedoensis var. nudiflora TaxID=2094558 RepID=A0A314YPA6_PRUYE|nr:hypothetical protein Pyn_09633 [Prunus yedoensis var. nudiflora]
MEGEGKKEAWNIEQGQIKGDQDHEFSLPSAHTIGHGNMGFILLGGRALKSLSIEAPMVHRYHWRDVLHICIFYSNNFRNERLAGSLNHCQLRLHCHILGGGG